jgi:hypothetical protein
VSSTETSAPLWGVSRGYEQYLFAQVVDGKHTAALERVGKIKQFDLMQLRDIANDFVGSTKQSVLKFMKCAPTSAFK